jgi:hypothetical protein
MVFKLVVLAAVLWCPRLVWGADQGEKKKDIQIEISVDPRVELISIIFRLAGNPEYKMGCVESYNNDIEEHFGTYRSHPAAQFAGELREVHGIGFDAPMDFAVHITDASTLKEVVPFDADPPVLNSRWQLDDAREFLEKARRFAKDARFDEFVESHKPLYDQAAGRMKQMLSEEINLAWFEEFFGAKAGASFHLVAAMANGGNCYGAEVTKEGKNYLYSILGVWMCDEQGIPSFDKTVVPTIVHEFCHSYCNPIVDAHAAELEDAGIRIFSGVEDRMIAMHYGNWKTVMYESLVRASVVRYMMANQGPEAARNEMNRQLERGFVWIEGLSELLSKYEGHRDDYPTVDAFFPQIVQFFNEYEIKQ